MATPSPPSSPPSHQPTYYISPHSPTQLRFPPSAQYTEWRGRCFKCCRTGHRSAVCRNPMRCCKCWGEGHTGFKCITKMLNPAALPYWSDKVRQPPLRPELKKPMEDILLKPCPISAPTMPANRPKKLAYFAERDPAYLQEVARLNNAVVFDTHGHEIGFKLSDVAGFAKRTQLVQDSDISIGVLGDGRFLIVLPVGIAPETFINKTTPELWDAGFTFQPWSPLDGARLVLPEYKALLTLTNVPPLLRREKDIAGLIGTFGIYLGTVPQEDPPNLSIWTAAVVVDRLERIPETVDMYTGGLEFSVSLHTKNWIRSPLYSPADLPKHQPKFSKPQRPTGKERMVAEELIPVSRDVLKQLCKDLRLEDVSEEVMSFLTSAAKPAMTLSQVSLLADLQQEKIKETGENSRSSLPKVTPLIPQENPPQHPNTSKEKADAGNCEAGHFTQLLEPQPPKPRRIKPKKITQPISILKRSSPQGSKRESAPIPRTGASVQDDSLTQKLGEGHQRTAARGQLTLPDNEEISKKRMRATKPGQDKNEVPPRMKHAQRPRRSIAFPPKHVTFKKSAQQASTKTRAQMKEAARKAEISFNKETLHEVSMGYGLCADIVNGCGFQIENVEQALYEDNLQRKLNGALPQLMDKEMDLQTSNEDESGRSYEDEAGPSHEGPDLTFDSGEDLESDEEMI